MLRWKRSSCSGDGVSAALEADGPKASELRWWASRGRACCVGRVRLWIGHSETRIALTCSVHDSTIAPRSEPHTQTVDRSEVMQYLS